MEIPRRNTRIDEGKSTDTEQTQNANRQR
jgi:hypothetical protein